MDKKTMEWHQLSPHEKKSEVQSSVGKVMASVLWDSCWNSWREVL